MGFLRFYLFCIDNGYIAGQSQIHRKNNMLGFNPENLEIIDKPKQKKKEKQVMDENVANVIPTENNELISQPILINNDNVADTTELILSIKINKLGARVLVDNII